MNLTTIVTINTYSIILLVILSFQTIKHSERKSKQYKLYMAMLHSTVLILIVDVMGRFDGNPESYYAVFNQVGNFLLYTLNSFIPSLWLLYVYFQFYSDKRKIKPIFYAITGANFLNFFLLIASQFLGWYYYIDANNVYYRGPLFGISVAIACILLCYSILIIVKNRNRVERKVYHTLLFFSIPPLIGIFLQTKIYGIPFIPNSVAIFLLIVFLNIQNQNIYSDYLTGVHNRKKLDAYLQEKVEQCKKKPDFSAILLDFDDFKEINDTFGHQTGDDALITAVSLIKDCLRPNDFLSRYGGDEFCIVLDIAEKRELENVINRIHQHVEKYNNAEIKPYKINFSKGYAIYDCKTDIGVEAFQNYIDREMYKEKKRKLNVD